MVSEVPDRPPSAVEARERMQRVRVGVTGLAAVVLVVALATAIASGVKRSAALSEVAAPPGVVATIEPGNSNDATEPLAQLGVAPDAKDVAERPVKRPN